MIETVTMSEDRLRLLLSMFVLIGSVFGYIMGRVVSLAKRHNQPKQRRTPEQRHTRSHW